MQELRNAIAATKLSNPQLSLKLGHSRKYITNLLSDGCSTELQKRLIEEISQIMAGTFKTDAEVIAELSEKLAEAQDISQHNANCAHNHLEQWKHEQKLKKETDELNAGLINTNTELNAELNAARKQLEISEQTLSIVRLNNSDLMDKIDIHHRNAQNEAQRIKTLELELRTSDEQNDQIRAIIGKHKVLGVLALLLVFVQVVIIWSLV